MKRKVNIYDYHDMLDYTEEKFEELFKKFPENKELLLELRGILRFYQLCMNLILGRADANRIMLLKLGKKLSKS